MVTVHNIQNKPVKVYTPSDELLVETDNELVFTDIRLQIGEQRLEGYYIVFEGKKVDIEPDGSIKKWPNGLFDIAITQMAKLISLR